MDPSDPDSFNHRTERLSTGHTYHFVDQIPLNYDPVTTPTVLCIHGFPDLWYGWRYVISPWVKSCGWRVVVPDMLGYGGTDKPVDAERYSTKFLCADLAALLDIINVGKAVIIGHDWGAATAWRFALWYPHRIRALVALSLPFSPRRSDYLPLEGVVARMPNLGYQLYFEDKSSTKEIEQNLSTFLSLLYTRLPGSLEHSVRPGNMQSLIRRGGLTGNDSTWLNEKEFQYYWKNFQVGGMNGPLNYYRTMKYRFDEEAAAQLPTHLPGSLPVLFLWGDEDPTRSQSRLEGMHQYIPSLQIVRLEGSGHWLQIESKDAVANSVAKFLSNILHGPACNSKL